MALKSMTGFARRDGGAGGLTWHWEIRSVNGRGLDLRFRLPSGFERLEQHARDACKKLLARGSCSLNLSIRQETGAGRIRLNEEIFTQVAEAARRAAALAEAPPAKIDSLLAIRGVIELSEEELEESDIEQRNAAMLADLELALKGLVAARQEEGARLHEVIAKQIDEIEQLTGEIEQAPARKPEAIRARLQEQIARLLDDNAQFDEQRLHQEAALLATKADTQEEIERLKAHVASARSMLASDEPVGRRMEFLAQEFNREANTICSKSNDTAISQGGLALKAVIDRLREQVQNIE